MKSKKKKKEAKLAGKKGSNIKEKFLKNYKKNVN